MRVGWGGWEYLKSKVPGYDSPVHVANENTWSHKLKLAGAASPRHLRMDFAMEEGGPRLSYSVLTQIPYTETSMTFLNKRITRCTLC